MLSFCFVEYTEELVELDESGLVIYGILFTQENQGVDSYTQVGAGTTQSSVPCYYTLNTKTGIMSTIQLLFQHMQYYPSFH